MDLTLRRSTISGNTSVFGGGLLILIDSDVLGNAANNGGGIYNKGQVVLDSRSRVGGNSATGGPGGGIYNEPGATVTGIGDTTFTPPNTPDDCFGCP